jgi:hypothetical protein
MDFFTIGKAYIYGCCPFATLLRNSSQQTCSDEDLFHFFISYKKTKQDINKNVCLLPCLFKSSEIE